MRILINGLILLVERFVLRRSTGTALKHFCSNMGLAYIKLAQILAMQNIGNLFTERDRQDLLHICDDCNPVPFSMISKVLHEEYGDDYHSIIKKISHKPVGSASVSQVHRALLQNGDEVVFKIKRHDVAKTVENDIKTIRFLMKYFGWVVGFSNIMGGNHALDVYMDWIMQELDFDKEIHNMVRYREFAQSVNGKLAGYKDIVMPKVYTEYCTSNVICMEYIPYKTISNLPINAETEKLIVKGVESYICLSFYALLHDMPVMFHGDPHAGNIYFDNSGNIGFLDMGLMFNLTPEDAVQTRRLFFLVYFQQSEKLFDILEFSLSESPDRIQSFKDDIRAYCRKIPDMPVTSYFMNLVIVCLRYNIKPFDFLFEMAKAFVCLSGIDTIYSNKTSGRKLLMNQVIDYILRTTAEAGSELLHNVLLLNFAALVNDRKLLVKYIEGIINVILDMQL